MNHFYEIMYLSELTLQAAQFCSEMDLDQGA